jgi:Tol biopolymer transport system component
MKLLTIILSGLAAETALATLHFTEKAVAHWSRGQPAVGKKGVMLLNRIGPSTSELYVANTDGSDERKLLPNSQFEYHASFSPDGQWITFTSERNGDGNSDIYRSRLDGSGLERLVATPSFEDAVVASPNGNAVAFVSTANGYKTNIWVKDLKTGEERNLTNVKEVAGDPSMPDGYFRPSWSPDGQWLTFASDRNTPWRGHGNGTGWEHTQELSIYVIRVDGSGFRKLVSKADYCLGSPKFSLDGKRVVYYEITTEHTWDAHRPEGVAKATAQIVSVDFATGFDRVQHTSGSGLKLHPQYVTQDSIGYLLKSGENAGLNYTSPAPGLSAVKGKMRSPAWSPDGKLVVYEKVGFKTRPMEKPLYSWDPDWEYRFTDVFPELSRQARLVITQKQLGNSSIVTMNPDGSDERLVFDILGANLVNSTLVQKGMAGAFQPSWSPDGEWIAFGVGSWFQARATGSAFIMRSKADGSSVEMLTNGTVNAGFPSYSHDGQNLVYRVWGAESGLRIIDVDSKVVRVLTTERDNLPFYSPDGTLIVFTRRTSATNFDICTIRPDGTDLKRLTTSEANDAHAVWTADGRILYSSGEYGFREEAANYDNTFQPYGQVIVMNADGSNKTMLTDSMWEDSMPLYIPNELLSRSPTR